MYHELEEEYTDDDRALIEAEIANGNPVTNEVRGDLIKRNSGLLARMGFSQKRNVATTAIALAAGTAFGASPLPHDISTIFNAPAPIEAQQQLPFDKNLCTEKFVAGIEPQNGVVLVVDPINNTCSIRTQIKTTQFYGTSDPFDPRPRQ